MYTNLDLIRRIQLDHTSRCNLACPQCARTSKSGQTLPGLAMSDLTLDDYKIILDPFKDRGVGLFHCGNFGDVIASPTFEETFKYSIDNNVSNVVIATNGSMRKPEWWANLAREGKNKTRVIFAIDGLEDTNHIYRVGSNYNNVIENAKAFIDAGGNAQWAFIEFKHNYHQIEEARQIATDLGFASFEVKYTARFADTKVDKVVTKKGKTVTQAPTKASGKNQSDVEKIIKEYKSFDNYTDNTNISCKFKNDNMVFIDMNMRLWPCCWFGSPGTLHRYKESSQTESFKHLFDKYGEDFNDMRKYGWDVLNHEFFQEYLERSWNNPDDEFKRIYTCGRTCGEKFEFSSGHGKNNKIERL